MTTLKSLKFICADFGLYFSIFPRPPNIKARKGHVKLSLQTLPLRTLGGCLGLVCLCASGLVALIPQLPACDNAAQRSASFIPHRRQGVCVREDWTLATTPPAVLQRELVQERARHFFPKGSMNCPTSFRTPCSLHSRPTTPTTTASFASKIQNGIDSCQRAVSTFD